MESLDQGVEGASEILGPIVGSWVEKLRSGTQQMLEAPENCCCGDAIHSERLNGGGSTNEAALDVADLRTNFSAHIDNTKDTGNESYRLSHVGKMLGGSCEVAIAG